ncbi:MAG: acyl-CoA thioesterase [Gammaproteobacteria bacterium]|nr:acyl-CoA thioesterase [Gammaproteobacteria bacterium]
MARAEFRFGYPFRVRYSEVDAQGVVFNAHYLTYFDTAITEYFRVLPYDYMGQVKQTGEDYHTVRTLVEYQAPILFDEDIEVMVRVSRIGRTSLSFVLEIHGADGEDLRATGEVVWVNTDQSTHRSAPLPELLLERLKAYEKDV